MIRQDFTIAGYWQVTVVYNVWLGDYNTGFTKTYFHKKKSIVGIGVTDSKEQFINTIVHEIKHLQSHICEYYNVSEKGEQAAYLIGYIAMKMFKVFNKLL